MSWIQNRWKLFLKSNAAISAGRRLLKLAFRSCIYLHDVHVYIMGKKYELNCSIMEATLHGVNFQIFFLEIKNNFWLYRNPIARPITNTLLNTLITDFS